jgi:hypothetical protein
MAHMLTVTAAGGTQEFEIATGVDITLDLVRTLFENCQKGEVVEVPVRVPGSRHPGHLIVNSPNVTSALIWEKEDVAHN